MSEETFQRMVQRGAFAGMEPPKSKYKNTPTVVDGIRFQSKAEARRWDELRMLEKAGEITDLKRQVAFPLFAQGDGLVGKYVSDFAYWKWINTFNGERLQVHVIEDVKGHITDLFKWKAKHFEAQYGFPITIIGGKK